MWGLLMLHLNRVFLSSSLARNLFFPLFCFFIFRSGWRYLKACMYMRRWCEPGSDTTQCLRGPTKAQWYTDRHGTFKHSDQKQCSPPATLSSFFALLLMAVSLKTLKVVALPVLLVHIYTELYITHPSPWNAKCRSIRFPHGPQGKKKPTSSFAATEPQCTLGTTRRRPCNNSLLTLLFQVVKVSPCLTPQSSVFVLSENDCIIRASEKDFKAFFFLNHSSLKLATRIFHKRTS